MWEPWRSQPLVSVACLLSAFVRTGMGTPTTRRTPSPGMVRRPGSRPPHGTPTGLAALGMTEPSGCADGVDEGVGLRFLPIGAQGLAGVLGQCSSLAALELRENEIGDEGARSLAQVLGECSSLATLDLG